MNRMTARVVSAGLAVLTLFIDPALMLAQQPAPTGQVINTTAYEVSPQLIAELPDSPSTSQAQNGSAQTQSSSPASSPAPAQSGSSQSGSSQGGVPSQPTGTAAAPAVTTTGNAASRPAGAAIAPPKQRQVRSFLIKLGFIAGAGAALGTVAALSLGSPSRVPGSH
ncbi:MAG: hypothetical protein JWO91_2745 [Acidobacteriaceae bacterium]|jgi:hypothetical protein|nr:hypothetical protein [Acidobacteriaceae bacterium]